MFPLWHLCCLLCSQTTKSLLSTAGHVLEWQLQLGSVLRIGGCQSFGGSHTFPSTVIHHCITIRRARTHCRRGKRGSSGNGGAASAVGGAQVMRKHWCGHTSFVEVLSASYFNNPLPTPPPPPPYHVKLYWGLSGFLRDCLAQGTQHLLGSPHKSPPGAAESGRYHSGRPAARQWQMHTFSQKYKALCCWADYGIANPMKTHDWKGVK